METRNGAHRSEDAMMLRRVCECGPEASIRPGTTVGQIHYLRSHGSKGRAYARSMCAHEHNSRQPGGAAHEKAASHSRGYGPHCSVRRFMPTIIYHGRSLSLTCLVRAAGATRFAASLRTSSARYSANRSSSKIARELTERWLRFTSII